MTQNTKHADKVIGFDLDGVIIDHSGAKVELAKEFGRVLTPEESQANIIGKLIPAEILSGILQKLYSQVSSQPIFPYAKEALIKFRENKIPFYIISRRRAGDNRIMAVETLKKNGLWPEIFNEDNVFFVDSAVDKNVVAERLGVTHYVDDESRVLDILTSVPNRFQFDPFGDMKEDSKYVCLSSWHDIESKL